LSDLIIIRKNMRSVLTMDGVIYYKQIKHIH